ncbi:MAG: hypothetical protein ACOC0C_06755, partial [Bacteroidota bacterium]
GFASAGDETTLQANDPELYAFFQSALCGGGVSAGTISGNQTICSGSQASEISNVSEGSPAGSISYSWYYSTNSTNPSTGTWSVVTDSTGNSLYPGALTQTTSYYRLATLGAGCRAMSNVVTVTVNSLPTPSITAGNTTVCEFETTNYLTDATGTITWSVSGGTIISGQGTNTIEIQWAELVSPATSATGSVTIEENNGSCTGTDVLNTTINLIPNTGPTYRKPNN